MKNFIQSGHTVTLAAPAAVKSGDLVVVGSVFGVASTDAGVNADVECKIGGVFDLTKSAGQAWTQGQSVYWDAAAKAVTNGSGSNLKRGAAVLPAVSAAVVGRVRLNGSF